MHEMLAGESRTLTIIKFTQAARDSSVEMRTYSYEFCGWPIETN